MQLIVAKLLIIIS